MIDLNAQADKPTALPVESPDEPEKGKAEFKLYNKNQTK